MKAIVETLNRFERGEERGLSFAAVSDATHIGFLEVNAGRVQITKNGKAFLDLMFDASEGEGP